MFYTYAHYTPQGRLFYIGKGQGERAHSKLGRNRYWHRVTRKVRECAVGLRKSHKGYTWAKQPLENK